MTIGQKIKELRLKNKMSQRMLGEVLGVTLGTINRYEIALTRPSLATATKLSEFFGEDITHIWYSEEFPNPPNTMGEKIRYLRKKMGLDQTAVAAKVGLNMIKLGVYEAGHSKPKITTLLKLCDLFGVSINYLMDTNEEISPVFIPPQNAPTIADKIRGLRLREGMAQPEFADLFGVTYSLICHYERGSRQPTIKMIQKMCKHYGTTAEWFLGIEK